MERIILGGVNMADDSEWTTDEEPLEMTPPAPETRPEPALLIIGRFQPFHFGHAAMIDAAISAAPAEQLPLRICIGSSNRPDSMRNPWTWQERGEMVDAWMQAEHPDQQYSVVAIPDLGDPENWVAHAEQWHGGAGHLFTTDQVTASLYEQAGWPVTLAALDNRESWEGWRIRATMQMVSTVEDEAATHVLSATIPQSVLQLLVENGWLRRIAFLGTGGEPVG